MFLAGFLFFSCVHGLMNCTDEQYRVKFELLILDDAFKSCWSRMTLLVPEQATFQLGPTPGFCLDVSDEFAITLRSNEPIGLIVCESLYVDLNQTYYLKLGRDGVCQQIEDIESRNAKKELKFVIAEIDSAVNCRVGNNVTEIRVPVFGPSLQSAQYSTRLKYV